MQQQTRILQQLQPSLARGLQLRRRQRNKRLRNLLGNYSEKMPKLQSLDGKKHGLQPHEMQTLLL